MPAERVKKAPTKKVHSSTRARQKLKSLEEELQEKLKLLGDLEQENQRLNHKASKLEAEIADDPPVLDLSPSPDDAAAAHIALGTEPLAPGAQIDPNTLTLLQDHLDGSLQALAQHKSSLAKHKHICASSHPGHHAILQKLHTCWCALLERMAPLLQQLQQASAAAAAAAAQQQQQQAGGGADGLLSATSTTAAAANLLVLPGQVAAPPTAAAGAHGALPPALLQQQLQARLEVVLKALSLILRGLLQAGPCYLWNFIWPANSPAHSTLRWALQDVALPPPVPPLFQQQQQQQQATGAAGVAGQGFMRLNGLVGSSSSSGGDGGGGLPSPQDLVMPPPAAAAGGAAGAQLQGLLNHAGSWPASHELLPYQPGSGPPTGDSGTSGHTTSGTSSGGSPCSGSCRPQLGAPSPSRGAQQRPRSAPYSSSSSGGGGAAPQGAEGVGAWAGSSSGDKRDMEVGNTNYGLLSSQLPGAAAPAAAMCNHHPHSHWQGPLAAAAGGGKGGAAAARAGATAAAATGVQQQDAADGVTDMVWEALADLPLTFVEDDITGELMLPELDELLFDADWSPAQFGHDTFDQNQAPAAPAAPQQPGLHQWAAGGQQQQLQLQLIVPPPAPQVQQQQQVMLAAASAADVKRSGSSEMLQGGAHHHPATQPQQLPNCSELHPASAPAYVGARVVTPTAAGGVGGGAPKALQASPDAMAAVKLLQAAMGATPHSVSMFGAPAAAAGGGGGMAAPPAGSSYAAGAPAAGAPMQQASCVWGLPAWYLSSSTAMQPAAGGAGQAGVGGLQALAAAGGPVGAAVPDRAHWQYVLAALQLTSPQAAALLGIHGRMMAAQAAHMQQQTQLGLALVSSAMVGKAVTSVPATANACLVGMSEGAAIMQLVEQFNVMLTEGYKQLRELLLAVWGPESPLTPMQRCRGLVASYPFFPDTPTLLELLAEGVAGAAAAAAAATCAPMPHMAASCQL